MNGKVQSQYNKKAPYYERLMHVLNYANSMQKALGSFEIQLPKNAKVLDIGCGTGLATSVLRKKYPDAKIDGFDFSESMLALCHKKLPEIRLINGDYNKWSGFKLYPEGSAFKFKPSTYDLIVSTGSLSEYGDLKNVLPKLLGLLKPGGRLMNIGIEKGVISWVQSKLWYFKAKGHHYFMKECKEAGFKKVERLKIPFYCFPTSLLKYSVLSVK